MEERKKSIPKFAGKRVRKMGPDKVDDEKARVREYCALRLNDQLIRLFCLSNIWYGFRLYVWLYLTVNQAIFPTHTNIHTHTHPPHTHMVFSRRFLSITPSSSHGIFLSYIQYDTVPEPYMQWWTKLQLLRYKVTLLVTFCSN